MHAPKFCALVLWRPTAALLLSLAAGLALGAAQGDGAGAAQDGRAKAVLGGGQGAAQGEGAKAGQGSRQGTAQGYGAKAAQDGRQGTAQGYGAKAAQDGRQGTAQVDGAKAGQGGRESTGQDDRQGGEAVRAQLFLGPGQQPPHDWRQLQALAEQSGGSAELKRLRDLRHSDKNPNSPQLRQSLVDFAQALNAGVTQVPALVLNEGAPLYSWSSLSREYRRAAATDRPPAAEQKPPARRTPQLGAATFSLAKLARAFAKGLNNPGCLRYCITGLCLYLKCTPLGCTVDARPRIRHRLPDLIVSSWSGGGHPWRELRAPMRLLADELRLSHGSGVGKSAAHGRGAAFREADVLANPVVSVPLPGLCKARTRAWQPHYSSLLDAALWRSGLSELLHPESWDLRQWNLGTDDHRFGSLFPRKGFGHYASADRGALVTAQRALDIAETGGMHLRWPPPTGGGRRPPGRAGRVRSDNCWQQIHPVLQSGCTVAALPAGQQATGYAWQLWTEYQCCPQAAGKLLKVVDFEPVCLH